MPEFRALLRFLRPTLKDADIPRRTKMRHRIVETFKVVIDDIRRELAVSNRLLRLLHLLKSYVYSKRSGSSRLPWTFGPTLNVVARWGSQPTT